jgi:hypothetical protein
MGIVQCWQCCCGDGLFPRTRPTFVKCGWFALCDGHHTSSANHADMIMDIKRCRQSRALHPLPQVESHHMWLELTHISSAHPSSNAPFITICRPVPQANSSWLQPCAITDTTLRPYALEADGVFEVVISRPHLLKARVHSRALASRKTPRFKSLSNSIRRFYCRLAHAIETSKG